MSDLVETKAGLAPLAGEESRLRRRGRLVERGGLVAAFLVVLGLATLFVVPIYWMVMTSLKSVEEVYHLPADDLYLVGTSEVALAGYHSDEIIDLSDGPLRYAGWSTCYRREAGSHGKDTRGIIRVHQFDKLEMFSYVDPADAEAEHERLLGWQEDMLQSLGLAYRVIDVAAGALGSSAARKFDVEAWVPTQQAYRELTSTSNCTTFQARRLDIRHRPDGGKTAHVATLNGTLATTRWIVAILETHQRADGSVTVPEALRGYLGGLEVLEPKRA